MYLNNFNWLTAMAILGFFPLHVKEQSIPTFNPCLNGKIKMQNPPRSVKDVMLFVN
ncbi:MAG: hypothetical protein M0Q38_15985 [Bacteroidales bacterium]|jgi:hypothetical protein|nr:hypothetical protein [Bacteroidales bacterium]